MSSSPRSGSASGQPWASVSMPNLGNHNAHDAVHFEEGSLDRPSSTTADEDGSTRKTPMRRLARALTNAEGEQLIFPLRRSSTPAAHEGPRFHLKNVARKIINIMRITERFKMQPCHICDTLQISLKKFIIQDHSSDPTQQAYKSYLSPNKDASGASFPRGAGSGKFRLGTLAEIQERSAKSEKSNACPVCRLIVESLTIFHERDLEAGRFSAAKCVASWQVDGREVVRDDQGEISESRPHTRRIQLSWDHPELEDSYLVLVVPEQRRQHEYDPQLPWSFNTLFLGRDISSAGNNQALAKLWLDTCSKYHGKVCQPEGGPRFEAMVSGAFFGVIDVHEMKLTDLPPGQHYAALSHVWGRSRHKYKTVLSSIQARQNPGELIRILGVLPKVIQDAIDLVRGLGLRFLWVDSLCIVQDSSKSWKLNSSVMDLVFGNAHLTICAADGKDAFEGLRGISKDRKVEQRSLRVFKDVRLMVSHLAETYVQQSTWNTRAWTFQERLLAKRCLIFAGNRMFFQCRCAAMSEDIVAEQQSVGWSIELVRAPLQLLQSLTLKPFWLYMQCVQLYTARELTRSGDILAAFMGMSNLLGNHLGAPLLFGLPSSHFDLALLWEPKQKCVRRRTGEPYDIFDEESIFDIQQSEELEPATSIHDSKHTPATPKVLPETIIRKLKKLEHLEQIEAKRQKNMPDSAFPSWSWCGWQGSTMEYRHETIAGCLENVRQWHSRHTWINWHIRDSKGNLRPIWDKDRAFINETNVQHHHNWFGYNNSLDKNASGTDKYGRIVSPDIESRHRNRFFKTLPEYPYKISIDNTTLSGEHAQPQLQFWTWSAYLRVNPHEQSESNKLGHGLDRYDILDYTGDWCGTIVLDDPWEEAPASEHEFIAISDAKNFSKDESDNWSYYIPHDREQSDWSLYYVLLIKREKGVAKRIGLGKVFKAAFENSCLPGKEWREIILE